METDKEIALRNLRYTLAKQVPDIEARGVIIGTAYGEFAIHPGMEAKAFARVLRRILERRRRDIEHR